MTSKSQEMFAAVQVGDYIVYDQTSIGAWRWAKVTRKTAKTLYGEAPLFGDNVNAVTIQTHWLRWGPLKSIELATWICARQARCRENIEQFTKEQYGYRDHEIIGALHGMPGADGLRVSKKELERQKRIAEEKAWIAQCGGDLAGYIRNYGSKNDPEHYGSGGEAIYAADMAALAALEGK